MGRHYSNDLRERVAAAVLAGRSCREVAALFSVSVASAVKWSQRLRQTGSAAAKPQGRQQPRALAPYQAWILCRLEKEKDLTMRALALELGARGIVTSEVSVWRVVRDARLSFKKNAVCRRAGSPGRGPQTPVLEEVSGPAGA
jgi:transposase